MALYFSHQQLLKDIEALPEITSLYHYLTFRIQTMAKQGSRLDQQLYLEGFVDYCTQVFNRLHPEYPPLRTENVMNAIVAICQMDCRHLKKLGLLEVKEGI
jgi:hypothetical protein